MHALDIGSQEIGTLTTDSPIVETVLEEYGTALGLDAQG